MVRRAAPPGLLVLALAGAASSVACAAGSTHSGFGDDGGPDSADGSSGPPRDGGVVLTPDTGQGTDSAVVTTVIYADTDTALYSVDPASKKISLVGEFRGLGGKSGDDSVTDLAVNAAGDVYVNTETVVYKAEVPSGAGPVPVTKVATIATSKDQSFYALAFAPPGVLGSGETLVGGDGNGEVWSIDPSTGATQDLGDFGPVPGSSRVFGVSGDIVFYTDGSGHPTGLATIRSCKDHSSSCTETDDYLAGIDMTALVAAYSSHTPATSLLAGIYGGSASSVGPGTGFGDLFGLGAWQGDVYAFSRAGSNDKPPAQLLLVDTSTGAGTVVPSSVGFTSGGWSGAGVSSRTSITVPPPPPPPK